MMKKQVGNRNLNIELLRIFSMFLITLWHAKVHFLNSMNLEDSIFTCIFNYLVLFINFHVNVFILITGFYGVASNIKGIIRTVLLVYFYSIVLNVVSWLGGAELELTNMLLPFSHGTWWFMQIYFVLLIIAPVIECYISFCSRKEYLLLLFGIIMVDVYMGFFNHVNSLYYHGYDIVNFVTIYLVGIWIRKDGLNFLYKHKYPKTCLVFWGLIVLFIQYKAMGFKLNVDITDYNSPYAIFMSVIVFLYFYKLRIPSCFFKIISFFSSSAIAVYLITDFPGVKQTLLPYFVKIVQPHSDSIYGVVLVSFLVMVVYFSSCCIDKLRMPITGIIEKIILRRLFFSGK